MHSKSNYADISLILHQAPQRRERSVEDALKASGQTELDALVEVTHRLFALDQDRADPTGGPEPAPDAPLVAKKQRSSS